MSQASAADLVRIVPYDPSWPAEFEAEKARLEPVLTPWLVGGIHHVGSTSMGGTGSSGTGAAGGTASTTGGTGTNLSQTTSGGRGKKAT